MSAHEEIALQLRIEPDGVAKIRRSDWWRKLPSRRRKRLHSVYFDTSDRRLRDLNISLHTETSGSDTTQTIELANGAADGAKRRAWTAMIPDSVPDPSLVVDPDLPQSFRALTASDLQPVFALELKRDTRPVTSEVSQIELTLDEGTVSFGEQKQELQAVELELVSGNRDELFAEARRLADVAAARLVARSLSELGYGFADRGTSPWSKAARLHLTAEMSAGDAFRAIARNCLAHLTANDDCARLNLHPEGVHQCRVALRRLRSLFRIYRNAVRRKRIEPIDAEAQWLGGILGSARDLDVLRSDLIEPATAALGEPDEIAPLIAGLEQNRAKAYAAVYDALSSSRYRTLLVDLCALGFAEDEELTSPKKRPAIEGSLCAFATGALATLHRKLLKRGRHFETLSREERHGVRIALKKMRYAVDFFGSVYEGEREDKFFKRLARLQEDLGSMNDVAVAEAKLARLTGLVADDGLEPVALPDSQGKLAFAAGCVLGWHRRRATEIDEHLVKDWHAFAKAKPFWDGP